MYDKSLLQDPYLDCYTVSSIKEKLGCDRESLIGLAVLLGCDYLPKVSSINFFLLDTYIVLKNNKRYQGRHVRADRTVCLHE